jgi:ferredoxin
MLVIDPDQCIDCGACVPECPAGAIVPENMDMADLDHWAQINRQLSRSYTPIVEKRQPPPDADVWNPMLNGHVTGKRHLL